MITAVVAPVLQSNALNELVTVKVELPQELDVDTLGTVGTVLGAGVPLPAALVQPFTVWVTVRVLVSDVVMNTVVAPVLHNNDPVKLDAVNLEPPQLSNTVTVGAGGVTLGDAVLLPPALVQPFKVCVTEYTPPVVTVMEAVVAVLLHNMVPLKPLAVSTELSQLSLTVTTGAEGTVLGEAVPLPAALVQPVLVLVCVTV